MNSRSLANLRLGPAAAGAKNRKTGHIQRIGREQSKKNRANGVIRPFDSQTGSAAGKAGGARRALETDNLESIKTPESLSAGGRAACHKRWHVADGGKFNPRCALCQEGKI